MSIVCSACGYHSYKRAPELIGYPGEEVLLCPSCGDIYYDAQEFFHEDVIHELELLEEENLVEKVQSCTEVTPWHFEKIKELESELEAAYAELRKLRPALSALFDSVVWERVSKSK
jgi:predicted  nucleic acid-binding Zn-ribbon protein